MKIRYSAKVLFRALLLHLYLIALFFRVIHCKLNRSDLKVVPRKRRGKICAAITQIVITAIYSTVLPSMFENQLHGPDNFITALGDVQSVTVTFFSLFSFVMQTKGEERVLGMMNKLFGLYKRILTVSKSTEMDCKKYLIVLILKMVTTIIGLINDVPALLQDNHFSLWLQQGFGIYLWIGSMLALDGCFLGFLIIALFFEELGVHLKRMLIQLENMTTDENGVRQYQSLTAYKRMQILCVYAERLDDFSAIYTDMHNITKEFIHIFQLQILYYIYYNFMVILLLMHKAIWVYLEEDDIHYLLICQVIVKVMNLSLLVMCADFVQKTSQAPNFMGLELVCSDIDLRWDTSVASFLNMLQTAPLKISVLGLLTLSNPFILVILSAIISYLFILIQFGITKTC